jgi:hypothetical protein
MTEFALPLGEGRKIAARGVSMRARFFGEGWQRNHPPRPLPEIAGANFDPTGGAWLHACPVGSLKGRVEE